MPLSTGQILNNRYRIVKLLGQGDFGAVFRAWDLNLNAPCALKESLTTTPEAVRQFTLEARLLANLRYVNLPAVIDHFSVEGQAQYLVMDFVEGQDLQLMLQRSGGPLPEGHVLAWMFPARMGMMAPQRGKTRSCGTWSCAGTLITRVTG